VQLKSDLDGWEAQLVHHRDTLARLGLGSLHTAPEFAALLDENGIPYITGEVYLKERSADEQNAALRQNPMLPFCFLVGKDDLPRAAALQSDGIDKVCPVLVAEKAEGITSAGERAVPIDDYGLIMCHSFRDSFSPDTMAAFRNQLEDAIIKARKTRDTWQAELAQVGKDIAFLSDFPHGIGTKQALADGLAALGNEQRDTSERREREKNEAAQLEESCEKLRGDIASTERDHRQAERNVSLFDEYLSRNTTYLRDYAERQGKTQQLDALGKRRHALGDDIEGWRAKS
jgi:hypothetical protein